MGLFGWSLPPGCGTLPGEEPEQPTLLFAFDDKRSVYWDSDGCIFLCNHEGDGEHILIDAKQWDDALSDKRNIDNARRTARKGMHPWHHTTLPRIRGAILLMEKKHEAAQRVIENGHIPYPEEYLDDIGAPEGDFKWDAQEAGVWYAYYCDDCDTYHKHAFAVSIERKDGKLHFTEHEVDQDGNWEIVSAYDTGDRLEDWHAFYCYSLNRSHYEHALGWARYHLWCAENWRTDPLSEHLTPPTEWNVKNHLRSAQNCMRGI